MNLKLQFKKSNTPLKYRTKPTLLLGVLLCLLFNTPLFAQAFTKIADPVTVKYTRVKASELIRAIDSQTAYQFFFDDILNTVELKNINFHQVAMGKVMDELTRVGLSFSVINRNITVSYNKPLPVKKIEPGKVSGKVVDNNGETLPGASIKVVQTGQAVQSNVDGTYHLNLQPGTYTIEVSYISYQTKRVTDIVVKEGQITYLDVVLNVASSALKEVVVNSSFKKESTAGMYAMQRRNLAITDGISSELIRRTPDRNAGDAIKRVTGVSVMEGKYVVVRGLADKYNYTMLNGGILPSTEPDKRSFSLDLIPALAIESIVVNKTATADMPGEFAGGVVQINTRDFPEQDFLSFSIGSGYYDGQTGKDFYKDMKGKNDWLGSAGSERQIPDELKLSAKELGLRAPEERFRLSNLLSKGWDPVLDGTAKPTQQLQIGYGKTFNFKNNSKFGIIALANYRRDQTIDQVERYDLAVYKNEKGAGDTLAFRRSYFSEQTYRFQVNEGLLLNMAYQFGKNKIALKSIFNRDFETVTTLKDGEQTLGDGLLDIVPNRIVDMHPTQKTLLGNQLQGEHKFGLENPVTLTWNLAYNTIKKEEPNQTRIAYNNIDPDDPAKNFFQPMFASLEGSSKLYSDLKEDAYNVNFAISTPFKIFGQPQTFKAGSYTQFRKRAYLTYNLGYMDAARGITTPDESQGFPTGSPVNFNQPIGDILSPINFRPGGLVLTTYELPANQYDGGANLASAFANMESNIFENLKLIYGARVEFYTMSLSTSKEFSRRLPGGGGVGDTQTPIDYIRYNTDVLPSVSLIYNPVPSINIRAAYAKTLTRPEFREISPYAYFDFVSGFTTLGNPELNRGTIQNLDFRAEWFPAPGEILSASIFRKKMRDPVELTTESTSETAKYLRYYKNIDAALNWGLEFELRKSLYFGVGPEWLRNLIFFGNYSRIHSNISGKRNGVIGEVDPELRKRPLMGQSPYLLNAGLLVNAFDNTFSFSAALNRVGRRIVVVGTTAEDREAIGAYPDVYENPRSQLDIQLGQKLLKQRLEIKLNAANLLNQNYVQYQDFDLNGKYSGEAFDATTYSRKSFSSYMLTLSYVFRK